MVQKAKEKGMKRREFLRIGVIGATSAVLGWDVVHGMSAPVPTRPFAFPAPVYRTLGRTGLRITTVSFGAMLTPEAEVMRVAFENGINYVDTARRYMGGRNEEIVGRALKGMRDRVYIATKTTPAAKTKTEIFRDVETSLRALQTDYIDVIQLHNLTGRERIFVPETREALLKLKEQGKVRFFGVTTHTNQAEVLHALADDRDRFFDTALVGYNFTSGRDLTEAIGRAAKTDIGIIAMKTQAGGYETTALGPVSPHQAALKWVLQNPHVTAAIPGMRDMAHLREDVAVMGMPFGYRDERLLKRYAAALAPFYCHLCGACEPTCPRQVAISTINRSLMYHEAYRCPGLARTTYGEIAPRLSAVACLDCAVCAARCIHGLDIAAKMKRARTLLA